MEQTMEQTCVSIYVKNNIFFTQVRHLNILNPDYEFLFIKIHKRYVNTSRDMVLGACYRPPSGNIEAFTNKIQEILNAYKGTDKYLYIAGDFNLDLLKHSSKLLIQVFMDTMISYALLPLITKPTRVTPTSKTLIDNVFSNNFVNSHASYSIM